MKQDQLIILGGGISGLVAAYALSPHFKEITIIDKDQVGGEAVRPGASQGAHLHVLLKEGQNILFKYLPELREMLLQRNCKEVDWALDTIWDNNSGRFPNYCSGVKTISTSRRLLESLIYSELSKLENVNFLKDFVLDYGEKGVVTKNNGTYSSDLTIVALGAFNNLKSNLALKKEITINLSYRSVIFKAKELNLQNELQYYYQTSPDGKFPGGVICPIEDNKYIATIIEYGNKISRNDKNFESFIEKSREIPKGHFFKIIKNAEPLTPVSIYMKKKMSLYSAKQKCLKLIFIGDSLVSLNPSFGQGMSVALLQIDALVNMMEKNKFSVNRFERICQRIICKPFFLAELGSRSSGLLKFTLDSYLILAMKSKKLHYLFLTQLHLLSRRGYND